MASEMARPGFWARVQRASVERLHIRLESLLVLLALSAVMAVLSPYFLSLSNFLIGISDGTTLNGDMSEFCLYDRALSEPELQVLAKLMLHDEFIVSPLPRK